MLPAIAPHDLEAERAVLGAVMLSNGEAIGRLERLQPGHFYRDQHRLIWRAMQELHEAGRGIDMLVLTDYMRRAGTLDNAGGKAEIDMLAGTVPMVGNYREYARIVHRLAQDRRRANAMMRMHEALVDGDEHAYRDAWERARP